MLKKRFYLSTFFASALCSTTLAGDYDGIWFGGYAKGSARITLQADFVQDLEKFDLEINRWDKYPFVECQYYASIKDGRSGKLILNAGASGDVCPREGHISLKREDLSSVSVQISGLPGVPNFKLNDVVRPIVKSEYATLPKNFDILGNTLGMSRAEIEANLVDNRGYVHLFDEDETAETANWRSEIVTYRKGDANEANDVIRVAYSAVPNGMPSGEAVVVMLHREANLGSASRLHIDTLRDALAKKYGNPTENDNRRYGRDGLLVRSHRETTQFCEKGNRQDIRYIAPFLGSRNFKSHCGSDIHVQISDDTSTGLFRQYRITLSSVDYLNNDFWVKLGTDRSADFSAFLDAVANASGDAPDL